MINPKKVDYHIHYYLDICATADMTMTNILKEMSALNFDEICILKHYTSRLPDRSQHWVNWKQTKPSDFNQFLSDFEKIIFPDKLRVLKGTESEILDDCGQIAIPHEAQEQIDAVILSCHWLPELSLFSRDILDFLSTGFPADDDKRKRQWQDILSTIPLIDLIENLVAAYAMAIKKNPKVKVLGHALAGLKWIFSKYCLPVERLEEKTMEELLVPLFNTCCDCDVLWEVTPHCSGLDGLLLKANRLGVKFCPTADAHNIDNPDHWGNNAVYPLAVKRMNDLGLTFGTITT